MHTLDEVCCHVPAIRRCLHFYTDLSASRTGLSSDPGGIPGELPQFFTLQAYVLTYIPSSCLPVFHLPRSRYSWSRISGMYVSERQQLHLVQFGFTLTSKFLLTSLTSYHNLLVRWRRVDPHAKSLFNFSRSRGQPNAFVVRMPSQAVVHLHPLPSRSNYFDLAVTNLQIQFSHSHGAAPRVHLQCKISLYLSTWLCSVSRRHRLLIRLVVPFASRCAVMSFSSMLPFLTLLTRFSEV
jgi:hypothetical protein